MIANWGYQDGSGSYYIAIDTDRCDGCGRCVPACPAQVLAVGEDPADPLRDEPVALVVEAARKKLALRCAVCKPNQNRPPLPCLAACPKDALKHSW